LKSKAKPWERKPVDERLEEYLRRKEGGDVKRAKFEEEKSEMEVREGEGPLIDTHRLPVLRQGEGWEGRGENADEVAGAAGEGKEKSYEKKGGKDKTS
jgi:hypothetical protein